MSTYKFNYYKSMLELSFYVRGKLIDNHLKTTPLNRTLVKQKSPDTF